MSLKKEHNNMNLQAWFGNKRSITSRLVVFYSTLTAFILAAFAGYQYWKLRDNFNAIDRHFLQDEMGVISEIAVKPEINLGRLQQDIDDEYSELKGTFFYARVLDKGQGIIFESDKMSDVLPVSVFQDELTAKARPDSGIKWKGPGNKYFYLMAEEVSVKGVSKKVREVEVALDITSREQMLHHYRDNLITFLILSLLIALVGGLLVTWNGLIPLRNITQKIKNISAEQLDERLNPRNWPGELTEMAYAFNKMFERLEESFNRLNRFSADIAHEIRTPVNNLMGETEVMLSQPRSKEEYREVLQSNLDEYRQLTALVNNLMFLARASNTRIQLDVEELEVANVIQRMLNFYQVVADDKNISLSQEGEATVRADPVMFRRVIDNVLSNALRYTPEDGRVSVQIKQDDDDGVHIEISDNGPGIEDEHLKYIFDRFYRVDEARTSDKAGMGLGLSIVKTIMKLHGGDIKIESKPGSGTRVNLYFPGK